MATNTPRPEFHPLSIARILWKRKLQVLLVWVIFSFIGAAVVYRLPVVYQAKTTILVDSQKIPDKFVTSTINTDVEDRLATLRKEILSGTELLKIINQFNLYADQRKRVPEEEIIDEMSKDTLVTLERGWTKDRPGAFSISYAGSDPQKVAEVANEIAGVFIQKNIDSREKRASGTTQFLKTKLDEARQSLAAQEEKVAKYKLSHNGELPEQEASLGTTLSRLQMELQGNQDATNRAQQNKIMVENSISAAESSIGEQIALAQQAAAAHRPGDYGPTTDGAPERPQPKASEVLQTKLDGLLAHYGDDYPEVKRLRAEIAHLREVESKAAAQAPQTSERPVKVANRAPDTGTDQGTTATPVSAAMAEQLTREKERLAGLKAQLAQANRELEIRSAERQNILNNIRAYDVKLASLPLRQQEMAGLTRDYEISKENYRSLLDKEFSAEMASDMEKNQEGEKFTRLEPARIPEIPIKPKRPLLLSGAVVFSLLISLLTAGFQEIKRGAILGEWELPADVAVLGRVPWITILPEEPSEPVQGGWLKRRWRLALVYSVLIFLACGITAVYLGWVKV